MGRKSAGFTLIEVLTAVTILAVSLLAIISAFPVAYEDINYGGRASHAVALAQQKLEELKASAFPPASNTAGITTTIDSVPFTVRWEVTSVGYGAATAELRKVDVTVSWPQRIRDGSYELVGLISDPN